MSKNRCVKYLESGHLESLAFVPSRVFPLKRLLHLLNNHIIFLAIAYAVILQATYIAFPVNIFAMQSGAVRAESNADYRFGQLMFFTLHATSDTEIEHVTLFVSSPNWPNTFTTDLKFEPGEEIDIEHSLDLTTLRLSPFTTVSYWWRVSDEEGNVTTVPERSIEYVDDRFVWQNATEEETDVYWTGDDNALGQVAIDIVSEALLDIQSVIPSAINGPLRIYIYPSIDDLQAALRLTSRDYVAAHAHPELGVILVSASNPRTAAVELGRSIPHELSHLALYQATGAGYENLPQWLEEGIATELESVKRSESDDILLEAIRSDSSIPFTDLCQTFPGDGEQPALAYAQSGSLVKYIQVVYGNQALSQMVFAVADGADCESVSRRVLGVSLPELSQAWLQDQLPRSAIEQIFRRGAIWLFLLLAGFLLMVFFFLNTPRSWKRRRGKE